MAAPDFAVLDSPGLPSVEPFGLLDSLPADVIANVERWRDHLVGSRPGCRPTLNLGSVASTSAKLRARQAARQRMAKIRAERRQSEVDAERHVTDFVAARVRWTQAEEEMAAAAVALRSLGLEKSVAEVAELLGVDETEVRRLLRRRTAAAENGVQGAAEVGGENNPAPRPGQAGNGPAP